MVLVLSECWTMTSPRDLRGLARMAVEAEDAGFDAVMLSEHIVLGAGADADGPMANPREYAMPGNQDPAMPWPDSQVLLGAMAALTSRLRLFAVAVIPPLRHPLALAKSLATLDLLSEGRLVVLPTPSWHRAEYDALGFRSRSAASASTSTSPSGAPPGGPPPHPSTVATTASRTSTSNPSRTARTAVVLHFGSQSMHERLIARIVRYGSGINPLGRISTAELDALAAAMRAAGRDVGELELVGGTRAVFPDEHSVADLGAALASIPEQMAQGFSTFCFKPSQFTDDAGAVGPLCREVIARVAALTA